MTFLSWENSSTRQAWEVEGDWLTNTNTVALVLVGILFVQAGISFFRVYLFAVVTEKSMADVRQLLYDKLITLSIPFFKEE